MDPAESSETGTPALLQDALPVTVDIQPFSTSNVINLGTRSYVSVVIKGTADFDVTTVDPSTARFGPGSAEPVHEFTVDSPTDHVRDIDADGYVDMMFHFDKAEAGLMDLVGVVPLTLTALTVDGVAVAGGEEVKLIMSGWAK